MGLSIRNRRSRLISPSERWVLVANEGGVLNFNEPVDVAFGTSISDPSTVFKLGVEGSIPFTMHFFNVLHRVQGRRYFGWVRKSVSLDHAQLDMDLELDLELLDGFDPDLPFDDTDIKYDLYA